MIGAEPEDLVATLTTFTVHSIVEAYRRWVLPLGLDEVFVTGGGARNPTLMRSLATALGDVPVSDGSALGMDPDAREAVGFAALAWAHRTGRTGNVPESTGAAGARILGSLTPGARS